MEGTAVADRTKARPAVACRRERGSRPGPPSTSARQLLRAIDEAAQRAAKPCASRLRAGAPASARSSGACGMRRTAPGGGPSPLPAGARCAPEPVISRSRSNIAETIRNSHDVGDEQHQREHHREGHARREDVEGHQGHDCERWEARQRLQAAEQHGHRSLALTSRIPTQIDHTGQQRREEDFGEDVGPRLLSQHRPTRCWREAGLQIWMTAKTMETPFRLL